MSEKVRIPFTFTVRKVIWRPPGEPLPAMPESTGLVGIDGRQLPVELELHPGQPGYDALIAQGEREYYAEKAAEAKEARRRAWETEEARWEPTPISPTTPPHVAKLYRNMRRLKQPSASSGSETQNDAPEDPWNAWGEAVTAATAAARARYASTVKMASAESGGEQVHDSPRSLLHDVSDDDPIKNPVTGQAAVPSGEPQKLESPVEEQEKRDIGLVPTGPGEEKDLLPPLIGAFGDRGAKPAGEAASSARANYPSPPNDVAERSGLAAGPNALPEDRSGIEHIFLNKDGHMPDTPENRLLVESVANDPKNFRGPDRWGALWWSETRPDGTQVWARTLRGRITSGGLNLVPKSYNPETGLTAPVKPSQKK